MGGIFLFGLLGLIIGPLIAAVFMTLLETFEMKLHPEDEELATLYWRVLAAGECGDPIVIIDDVDGGVEEMAGVPGEAMEAVLVDLGQAWSGLFEEFRCLAANHPETVMRERKEIEDARRRDAAEIKKNKDALDREHAAFDERSRALDQEMRAGLEHEKAALQKAHAEKIASLEVGYQPR